MNPLKSVVKLAFGRRAEWYELQEEQKLRQEEQRDIAHSQWVSEHERIYSEGDDYMRSRVEEDFNRKFHPSNMLFSIWQEEHPEIIGQGSAQDVEFAKLKFEEEFSSEIASSHKEQRAKSHHGSGGVVENIINAIDVDVDSNRGLF